MSKYIKKYNAYRILEFTEFNVRRFNPDVSGVSPNVNDPDLGMDSYDQHASNVLSATRKLNSILATLNNSGFIYSVTNNRLIDGQEISDIKIQRMYQNGSGYLDVYITFVICDKEYFGVIKNFDSLNPEVKTEAFIDNSLIKSKEWIIRTKGLLIKCVKKWMEIERGEYLSLKDILVTGTLNGNLYTLKSGSKIKVLKCYDNKLIIDFKGTECLMDGLNYFYFNWWFEKIG